MKTLSKKLDVRSKSDNSESRTKRPKTSPRKNIEDTDLNSENSEPTNISRDEDSNEKYSDTRSPASTEDTTVEEEQDREVVRKMEDAHPDEIMK